MLRRFFGLRFNLLAVNKQIDFGSFEPGDFQIKLEVNGGEMLEFDRQHLGIPSGVVGQFVVGNDVCAFLRFGEMLDLDGWNFGDAELASGGDPSVAGNYRVRLVDEDWTGEFEFPDRRCDLMNLLGGMRPCVACKGL